MNIENKILIETAQKKLQELAENQKFSYNRTGKNTAEMVAIIPVPEVKKILKITMNTNIEIL